MPGVVTPIGPGTIVTAVTGVKKWSWGQEMFLVLVKWSNSVKGHSSDYLSISLMCLPPCPLHCLAYTSSTVVVHGQYSTAVIPSPLSHIFTTG